MLAVRGISKSYGDNTVLSNLSITIPKSKITSFIGENGAGKSTILSIISGMIKKSSGEIFIDNENIEKIKKDELAKKLSILKQSNYINMKITVEELVSFGRFPYSKGKLTSVDKKMVQKAIDYVELNHIKHMYLHQLSGGLRQRALVAMVIAQDTDYILLDEPLNNLDMKHSVQIMKILRQLADELGKTIVIVIHEINFASCYSDYVAAIKNGKLQYFGKTEEIIDKNVLKDVFNMEFNIKEINKNKICVYF